MLVSRHSERCKRTRGKVYKQWDIEDLPRFPEAWYGRARESSTTLLECFPRRGAQALPPRKEDFELRAQGHRVRHGSPPNSG